MPNISRFKAYDFDDEEIETFNRRYKWGDPISNEDILFSMNVKPVFSYGLIDINKTDYNFQHANFDNKDIKEYFKVMNKISTTTIQDILDSEEKRKLHFYRSNINGNLSKALNKLTDNKYIQPRNYLPTYHFALYTNEKTDRNTKIKSPRIYLMVGEKEILYILFYDPYHEINP
ncbi:hypothetical protein EZS27_019116 [termite gut metagenome]|uniref:Uncharacterized protein n=1 Tax=termite gut metagenome TaxID=433724 RepID=A0A5J4RGU9_9ZZZZ